MAILVKFLLLILFLSVSLVKIFAKSTHDHAQNRPIRVCTRQYEPFMKQNDNGSIHRSIEYQLLKTIAAELERNLSFDIAWNNPSSINSDVLSGGLFPNLDGSLMSIPYFYDDLTWCVQKARPFPIYLNIFLIATPESWLVGFFVFGYGSGFLLYLLIQFDSKYKYRNFRDWHYTTLLITLPVFFGLSPRFQPLSGLIRIFYGVMLFIGMFIVQAIGVFLLKYLKIQIFYNQISTIDELLENNFRLMGSHEVFNMISQDEKYSNHSLESFFICNDLNNCLEHLKRDENYDIAVGGSRQHLINSPNFSPWKIHCFEKVENIVTYPVALHYPDIVDHMKAKIDGIIRNLFENGLFEKWGSDSQRRTPYEAQFVAPLSLTTEEIAFGLIFVMSIGTFLSCFTFICELIVHRQMQKDNRRKFWTYWDKFFDGRRHYFKNLPESLLVNKRK